MKKLRNRWVMVYMADDEKKALEALADGEPLGRVARDIILNRLISVGVLDKPKR